MKTLLIIFAISTIVFSSDVPLGQSFKGNFGSFVDGALDMCNIDIDPTIAKAVWLPPQWFSNDLCNYCLMVFYKGTSGIYPITDNCIACDGNLVLLSVFAFKDFGDPDTINLFFGANFTFVNCPTTSGDLSTEVSATETTIKLTDKTTSSSGNLATTTSTSSNVTKITKYICTLNHTVELEADKIVYIESPDFPRRMNFAEKKQCSFYFTKQPAAEEVNKKLWIVLTNLICDPDNANYSHCRYNAYAPDFHSYFQMENFTSNFYNISQQYAAFQGYVIFDDWSNTCPLQSISRVEPYHIIDESQILYLWGRFNNQDFFSPNPCVWQFTAPWGYGFKVVVEGFNQPFLHFKIDTRNYTIATEKNVERTVFYTSENNLQVWFFTEEELILQHYMAAYVSIIKNQYFYFDANCSVTKDGSRTSWSNYDEITGYQNYAKCSYTSTVKPNTEIIVTLDYTRTYLEDLIDRIYFHFNKNSSFPIAYATDEYTQLVFYPNDGNTERNVLCEFVSDGSWNSLGFTMYFDERNCGCRDSPVMTIPCDSNEHWYTIMNSTESFYCGNLNCTFSLISDPSCSKKNSIIEIQLYSSEYGQGYDVFAVISDNVTVGLMTSIYFTQNRFLFSSKSTNILQVNTVQSNVYRTADFFLRSFDTPAPNPKVTLSEKDPFYVHSICSISQLSIYEIELSSNLKTNNATVDFYVVYYQNSVVYFYKDILAEEIIYFDDWYFLCVPINKNICFSAYSFPYGQEFSPKCKTQKSNFAVLQYDTNYPCYYSMDNLAAIPVNWFSQLIIFYPTVYSDNCVFKTNVIDISELTHTKFIKSQMSNSNGICKFLIATNPRRMKIIKKIWTSPTSKGIINIFAGQERKKFLSIDTENLPFWYDIVLFSSYYVVEIPKDTSIVFYFEESVPALVQVSAFPYFSIATSPLFGEKIIHLDPSSFSGAYTDQHYNPLYIYNITEYDVKFTLNEYNVAPEVQYYFVIDGEERINITAGFKSKTFSNAVVEIFCKCYSVNCFGTYDLLLNIESLAIAETS